ncbi:hypothetical protein [Listeria seeligeri]|uniref:hypothetical protein n=1 Tax=Listeria seeligeri TaxID=1640 RepID=UPI0022EB89A7|nr:hypothetical protein [Listeria seeligeri]
MPKLVDLLGKKIGRLTVVEKLGKREGGGGQEWRCHCECGKTDYIATTSHLNKNTGIKSCGCYFKEVRLKNLSKKKKFDLTGKKIGRLLVVKEVATDKPGRNWLCICDCGNEYVTTTSHLNRKTGVKSCGCYVKELAKNNSKTYTKNATKEMYQEASKKIKQSMKNNNEWVENTRLSSILSENLRSDNKSGHRGVTFKDNKWVARICVSGKEYYLGSFDRKEEAIVAREEGEELYFKPILDKYRGIKESE